MFKQIHHKIATITGVLVMSLLVAYLAIAWQEPTAPPPLDNVPAPVNVGPDLQYKTGVLGLGGLVVDQDTHLAVLGGKVGVGTTMPGAAHSEPDQVGMDTNNQIITGVKMPIDNSDAVPKGYVDAQTGGGGDYFRFTITRAGSSWTNLDQCPTWPCAPGHTVERLWRSSGHHRCTHRDAGGNYTISDNIIRRADDFVGTSNVGGIRYCLYCICVPN